MALVETRPQFKLTGIIGDAGMGNCSGSGHSRNPDKAVKKHGRYVFFVRFSRTFTRDQKRQLQHKVNRMSTLFMVNVPHNCTDDELSKWVESSGIAVKQVRLIRDLVASVSPSFAYVEIQDSIPVADAVQKLNGHNIRERMITVSEARNRVTAA